MIKLKYIADGMRMDAENRPFGYVHKTLAGGLELVLSHIEDQWRLALRRENVYPSANELAIVQPLFNIPVGTEPSYRQHVATHPTTHRRITWQIVEFSWREIPDAHHPDCAATA